MSQYRQLETMIHSIPGQKGLFLVCYESSCHVVALCFLPTTRIVSSGGFQYCSDNSDEIDRSSEATGIRLYRKCASFVLVLCRHIHNPRRTASVSTRSLYLLIIAMENVVRASMSCVHFGEVGYGLR